MAETTSANSPLTAQTSEPATTAQAQSAREAIKQVAGPGPWPDKQDVDRTDEINAVIERMYLSDPTATSELRRLMRQVPGLKNWLGGRPDWNLEKLMVDKLASDPLRAAATRVTVDEMYELLPDWPDDLRYQLLGERLINSWLEVQLADRKVFELESDDEQRQQLTEERERAHRRHLAVLQASLKR